MKKSILQTARSAAIAALLCLACNDSGIDTSNSNWRGNVDRFLSSGGGGTVLPIDSLPSRHTYTVKYDGNGSDGGMAPDGDSYRSGATVTVKNFDALVKDGFTFSGWNTQMDGNGKSYSAGESFNIYENTTLYAMWKPTPVGVQTYTVTVTGGTGGRNYEAGETVTIEATVQDGKQFTHWMVTDGGVTLNDDKAKMTTFTMPANAVTVTAVFDIPATDYQVTIACGQGGGADWISGKYAKGTTVYILALPESGYAFGNWTSSGGGVIFTDANNAATSFIMPGNEVTVMANFVQQHDLVLDLEGANSSGTCTSGGENLFCQYSYGCYELNPEYNCGNSTCTCADLVRNCEAYGAIYKGVTGLNENNNWGTGVVCAQQGGTQVYSKTSSQPCGGYCKWETGCYEIRTDPNGENGTASETCAEAVDNCRRAGEMFINSDCSDRYEFSPAPAIAKSPAIRAYHSLGKVNVTWTAATRISGGTAELVSAAGDVVAASAVVRANGKKITAILAADAVSSGMYYVRIRAMDAGGNDIVESTPVGIVK
jgi:uncharacterized repeat protein (TIGR02543 family)